jgi:hypothetical protein
MLLRVYQPSGAVVHVPPGITLRNTIFWPHSAFKSLVRNSERVRKGRGLGKSWQCMNVRITQLLQNKWKLQQTTCNVLFNLSDGRTEMTVVKTCTIDKERQERKHSTLTLLAPSHYLAEAKKKYRYRFRTISILSFFPSFLLNPISSTYSMYMQSYC